MILNKSEADWSTLVDGLASHRHALKQEALPPGLVDALAAEFTQYRAAGRFRPAGIGRGQGTGVNTAIRGDAICWLEPDMPAGGAYLALMEELREVLNRELYLGLREFEAHYACYSPGTFYRRHVDRHAGSEARVISSVFYLNRDWPEGAGGELRLYGPDDALLRQQAPAWNSLLLFTSDDLPHEVLAATRERWSIAGWFRR